MIIGMFLLMLIGGIIYAILHAVKRKTLDVVSKATETPLMKAAVAGDVDKIKELLASGVFIDEANAAKNTALSLSVINNKEEAAKILIDAGANLNMLLRDEKDIFTLAIESKNAKILMFLIEKTDVKTFIDKNLLNRAVKENFGGEVIRKFLEKDIEGLFKKVPDNDKYCSDIDMALLYATKNNNIENIDLLLKNGAGLSANPIWFAVANGSLQLVKKFIELGDNIEGKDESGRTCLALAVSNGYYEIAELLLENKANPNIQVKHPFQGHFLSLLSYAKCWKSAKIMTPLLIKYGAKK